MPDRELMLLQNSEGPLLAGCACGEPVLVGEYVVAQLLEGGGRAALCGPCARQAAPALAVVVESLNGLAATAGGLAPQHSLRLLCALVEQVARLAGPTVALLNVNPQIVERINGT